MIFRLHKQNIPYRGYGLHTTKTHQYISLLPENIQNEFFHLLVTPKQSKREHNENTSLLQEQMENNIIEHYNHQNMKNQNIRRIN